MTKIKITSIKSREFELKIVMGDGYYDNSDLVTVYIKPEPIGWYVRNRETCADTKTSSNFDDYKKLKRVWRKSKEDFDSACRFMDFNNLFSTAGVNL